MHLLWPGSETRTRISSFNEKFERIEWDRGVGRRSHFPFRPLQSLLERLKPKGSKGSNGKKRNSEAIEFPSSRDLLATQKSEYAGLNIVEIGILSFSPPLFSTYSYSKEGKKSLVQPWNHLFQLVRLSILKVLTMSTYQYFSLFHCLDFTLRYIDQFDVRRGIFVWSNVILYLQSWNDEN